MAFQSTCYACFANMFNQTELQQPSTADGYTPMTGAIVFTQPQ